MSAEKVIFFVSAWSGRDACAKKANLCRVFALSCHAFSGLSVREGIASCFGASL